MNTATIQSNTPLSGFRSFEVSRGTGNGGGNSPQPAAQKLRVRDLIRQAMPTTGDREVDTYRLRNLPNMLRGLATIAIAKKVGAPTMFGVVRAEVKRADGSVADLGVISCRVVTTAGVNAIVDAFQNTFELETFIYHGFGTGSNAEASGNTALHTELTTEYVSNNTRPTGSATEGASANIYRSVGTLSPDATVAITEHGIFNQASNAGGTLLDKSLFSAINLISGDSLQITYDLQFTAGS